MTEGASSSRRFSGPRLVLLCASGALAAMLAGCPSNGGNAPTPPAPPPQAGSGGGQPTMTPMPPAQPPAVRGPGILERGNNLQRLGANLDETILHPGSVNADKFGKLFCRDIDGEVYAQVLYVPNLEFAGKGRRNAIFVATMKNKVYAFDADRAQEPSLWEKSYIDESATVTPVPARDVGRSCGTYRDISTSIGVLGTPAIDSASSTIYFVTRTKEGADAEISRRRAWPRW
jgi:hypothetical protein